MRGGGCHRFPVTLNHSATPPRCRTSDEFRSGEFLGRYEFGSDIDFPVLADICATSREGLLDSFGREARMLGLAVGNELSTVLAADVRGAN